MKRYIKSVTYARNDMASKIKREPTLDEIAFVDAQKQVMYDLKSQFDDLSLQYQRLLRMNNPDPSEVESAWDELQRVDALYIDAEHKYMELWDTYIGYSYY